MQFTKQTLETRQPFWYQTEINWADNANVGVTAQASVILKATTFVCTKLWVISRVDASGILVDGTDVDAQGGGGQRVDPAILLEISQTGTDRTLMNVPIDAFLLGAERSLLLPQPIAFRASSTINLRATLLRDTGTTNGIDTRFVFEGWDDYGLRL